MRQGARKEFCLKTQSRQKLWLLISVANHFGVGKNLTKAPEVEMTILDCSPSLSFPENGPTQAEEIWRVDKTWARAGIWKGLRLWGVSRVRERSVE